MLCCILTTTPLMCHSLHSPHIIALWSSTEKSGVFMIMRLFLQDSDTLPTWENFCSIKVKYSQSRTFSCVFLRVSTIMNRILNPTIDYEKKTTKISVWLQNIPTLLEALGKKLFLQTPTQSIHVTSWIYVHLYVSPGSRPSEYFSMLYRMWNINHLSIKDRPL